MSDEEKKKPRNYLVEALTSLILVLIISFFWKGSIAPFTLFSLWESHGNVVEWLSFGWPMLLWGVSASCICITIDHVFDKNLKTVKDPGTGSVLLGAFLVSTWAGIAEEICFRWLIFLNGLWLAKVVSLVFCGLPEWIYLHIMGPIANFATLNLMEPLLFHPASWAVGSSILATNGFFRDGHKYQGLLGYINSWYIGMFLFWVAMTHGLLAAIFLHFLYDLLVFSLSYACLKLNGDIRA